MPNLIPDWLPWMRPAGRLIWGVTLLNDWSIRNDMGPPRPLNFNLAKNFDTSVSIGPCIVVGELAVDGNADNVYLGRVAETIAAYVLLGWDTGGVSWDP